MGAWGAGVFDNDDAMDWLADFDAQGLPAINAAFDAVLQASTEGYVEAPDGSIALAAAAVVAMAGGAPTAEAEEDVRAMLDRHRAALVADPGLRPRANASIDAIMADAETSELLELWHDADPQDTAAFQAAVQTLRGQLQ